MNIADQLKRDEGEFKTNGRHVVYQDHLGYWTIGIGRLVDPKRGGGLSDAEVEYLLNNDIERVTSQLAAKLSFWTELNEARRAALINMAFQLGVNGLLGFRKTLNFMTYGQYDKAAHEAMHSRWAAQTPNRARRVAEQIRTGEWQ